MTQGAPRVLKVLMLHGHGQNSEIFMPKARYICDYFQNLSDKLQFDFEYLPGIWRAYPDDDRDTGELVWGYGDPTKDTIRGLEMSVRHILGTLEEKGPFAGVIGFSSGAAMAFIIASILEKQKDLCGVSLKTEHTPLKFALCLSGFKLDNKRYGDFYNSRIDTPVFHTIGELDTTVSPQQTESLIERCSDSVEFRFFGTHYVPQFKEARSLASPITKFLSRVLEVEG